MRLVKAEDQTPDLTIAPPEWSVAGLSGASCSAVSFPPNVPALSIRQPWAWAIVTVGKDIENRCWRTSFRGRVLIHAAKGCTRDEYIDAKDFILGAVAQQYRGVGISIPAWRDLQRGGIIGYADIVDCVSESDSPWFVGEWGFVLENVRTMPFTPCRGALGFFYPQNKIGEQ